MAVSGRVFLWVLGGFYFNLAMAWNAMGHRVIAAIAYQHLTPKAKMMFNAYNHALDTIYPPQTFINAATWLDNLRSQGVPWFNAIHYINKGYTNDNTPLPTIAVINAVWAIGQAKALLVEPQTSIFDKGLAFRVLLHVVGDIHQPLHAVTRVSRLLPNGDNGGNEIKLPSNTIAANLHAYWDRGGGLLLSNKHQGKRIRRLASQLQQQWPCDNAAMDLKPSHWADESYLLAVTHAYKPFINSDYQHMVQQLSAKRVALAGCRLAALLNEINAVMASPKKL